MQIGLGLGLSAPRGGGGGSPVDQVIAMLAHRVYGAGYNSGAAPPTGDGTAKTHIQNYVNDSGAAISVASIVYAGWTLRTTGTTDASATFTPSGTIEYPVGTTIGTVPATAVAPGVNVASADITLSATIPVGGTFRVSLSATPANGATYISNLGFAGLRNHALRSTLKKVCIAGFGDSIMTNNGGALYNAASGRCGAYLNSIAGTTAQTYAPDFSKQAGIASLLGATDVLVNFGTNDLAAGRTSAQLTADYVLMRTPVRALGMKWNQCTILPRTTGISPVSATLTSSGNSITATVADASKFKVGRPYSITGATQTEYNNSKICTARDLGANTLTLHFQGSGVTPATGTITIGPFKATAEAEWMTPLWPGAGSVRGLTNAWIRDSANTDGFIDWGDACEAVRDSCMWLTYVEDPTLLPDVQEITVSSVISTSRFNSNYNKGSSTIPNGFVTPKTGANIGITKNGNGNTNGDITVSSAWTNAQAVNDVYYAVPGVGYMSDDHLHPRASSGNKGGQVHLDNPTAAWIDLKAA